MGTRKWDRPGIAARIVESALSRPVPASSPDVPGDWRDMDVADLQSQVVRAGRFAWSRQSDAEALSVLSDAFRSSLVEPSPDPRAVARAAYARVAATALEAMLSDGEYPCATPADIDDLAPAVIDAEDGAPGLVTKTVVRSMLQPLYNADRAGFRELIGALGGVIGLLDATGMDGRVPNMIARSGYQELRALQGFLNGVLRASRAGAHTPARETAGAGSAY